MYKTIDKTSPRYRFKLHAFDYDPELEKSTNLKLAQLLALAPPDATAVCSLDIDESDGYYVAEIEVKSRYRTFRERAAGVTPRTSVKHALEKIEDRLYRWRFGGGDANPPAYQQTVLRPAEG